MHVLELVAANSAVVGYAVSGASVDPTYYGGSGGNAFCLPALVSGNADTNFQFKPSSGGLDSLVHNTSTGIATMTGSIYAVADPTLTFDVQIDLNLWSI